MTSAFCPSFGPSFAGKWPAGQGAEPTKTLTPQGSTRPDRTRLTYRIGFTRQRPAVRDRDRPPRNRRSAALFGAADFVLGSALSIPCPSHRRVNPGTLRRKTGGAITGPTRGDPMTDRNEPTGPPVSLEARCTACGETFTPADEHDTEHLTRSDGTDCGGEGELIGGYR